MLADEQVVMLEKVSWNASFLCGFLYSEQLIRDLS